MDFSPELIVEIIQADGRKGREQLFEAEFPDKIEKLCLALRQAQTSVVRQVLCNLFASLEDPSALECLLDTLRDTSPEVVAAAEDAIGNCSAGREIGKSLSDRLGVELLALFADSESPTPVKTGAVYALGLMRYHDAVPMLLSALESPLPIVRWNVAEALSYIGDPSVISLLQDRYLRESDERVRRNIRVSLSSLTSSPSAE